MRRRLTFTIVGSVVAALVLAGLGTLLLAEVGARRYAEGELRRQVEAISDSLPGEPAVDSTAGPAQRRVLDAIRAALRLEGVGIVQLTDAGGVRGELPAGIELERSDIGELRSGEVVSGRQGRLVFAAATIGFGDGTTAVVLSDRIDIAFGGTLVWFLIAGTAVVVLAVVVSRRLARALTGPLRRAESASRRIAEGDLSARVPEPPADQRDEMADLSRSINSMAGALERSRTLEQQFLLSVSHDLRTPLTSIQGYAEALVDRTTTDGARAGSVILSESRRLNRLVRDLLDLARLDARQFSLESSTVDLDDLVEACVEGFAPEAASVGIAVEVTTEPATVDGDPDRLAQVVANLLENAVRFARSRVVVAVSARDGRAAVTVDDDGPGIDAVDLPHVFERLYVSRGAPARAETSSGLGLAIVRQLVEAMDGSTGAERSELGGAHLWLELPAVSP